MDALEAQKDRVFVAPAINFPLSTLTDAADFGCKYSLPSEFAFLTYETLRIQTRCRKQKQLVMRARRK
jgi:hypothetical protein